MEIQFNNIRKSFTKNKQSQIVLDDISWNASGGEVVAILGPNGSGKSTMLRILLSIIKEDHGEVLINSGKLNRATEKFRHIVGYLPEERALYKIVEVEQTILYFAMLKGLSLTEAKSATTNILKLFDLVQYKKAKNQTLSKGLAQRVQLACSLVHSPQLLILDEPFYGLDPVNAQVMREVILQYKMEGKLILLCTHQMKEVENICDTIVMVNQGKIALFGKLKEIQEKFSNNELILDNASEPENLPSVKTVNLTPSGKRVVLHDSLDIYNLLEDFSKTRKKINKIEQAYTPLEDIFVKIVRGV